MRISLQILVIIALLLSNFMYISESTYNTDYTFPDALIWTFVKFVDDPADIVEPPSTAFGQIVGPFISVVDIAIFAVPTGLIGSLHVGNGRKQGKEGTFRGGIKKCYFLLNFSGNITIL